MRLGWWAIAIAIAMPSKLHLEISTFNKTKQMKHLEENFLSKLVFITTVFRSSGFVTNANP